MSWCTMRRLSPLGPTLLFLGALALHGGGCATLEGAPEGPTSAEEVVAGPDGPLALSMAGVEGDTTSGAPFSFTASDGTGLRLASITSDTAIEDPIALTQLH